MNFKKEVLSAVSRDGNRLRDFPELQNDKEVVMAAVSQDGHALGYASLALRKDKEVVLAAIRNDPDAFWDADPSLRSSNDKDFILQVVSINGLALLDVSDLKEDHDVLVAAIIQNGEMLQFAPEEMKTRELVLAAVTSNGLALEYVTHLDQEIVLTAVKQNGDSIKYAGRLREDPMVLFHAFKHGYNATDAERRVIHAYAKQLKDSLCLFLLQSRPRLHAREQKVEATLARLNAHGPHFAAKWKHTIKHFIDGGKMYR
jgi:Domain of unknown function (DUF4116)